MGEKEAVLRIYPKAFAMLQGTWIIYDTPGSKCRLIGHGYTQKEAWQNAFVYSIQSTKS